MSSANGQRKTKVVELALKHVIDTEDTQPRVKMYMEYIKEYSDKYLEGIELPPIVVFFDGHEYHLADGFHRVRGAKKAGKKSIKAIVYDGDKRDALLYSVGANSDHGIKRTKADTRRNILRLLDDTEWCQWSDRVIAEKCRASHGMVSTLRKSHPEVLGHNVSRRMSASGRILNIANIGNPPKDKTEDIEEVGKETFFSPIQSPESMTKEDIKRKYVTQVAATLRKTNSSVVTNLETEFGIADVVTDSRIYVFANVNRRVDLFAALGQLQVIKHIVNQELEVGIIGHFSVAVADLIRQLRDMGVDCRTADQVIDEGEAAA